MMRDFLARLSRRARLVAAREAFLDAFFWSSYAAASLLVADRIRLEFDPEGRAFSDVRGAAMALVAALAVSALAAAARAARTRPADVDLARAADRSLGLSDRVATAVEEAPGAFAPLVRREAEAAVAAAAPRRVLPAPPAGARRWSAAAVLAALLIVLFPLPQGRPRDPLRPVRPRRPMSGAAVEEGETAGGGSAASAGGSSGSAGADDAPSPSPGRPGRGRPAPPPPLFGDPDRGRFNEHPEHVDPLVRGGDWKPSGSLGVDSGAAAAGAPEAASDAERLAAYRRQAEAFVGRDGCSDADRGIVKGYFDRVAPDR